MHFPPEDLHLRGQALGHLKALFDFLLRLRGKVACKCPGACWKVTVDPRAWLMEFIAISNFLLSTLEMANMSTKKISRIDIMSPYVASHSMFDSEWSSSTREDLAPKNSDSKSAREEAWRFYHLELGSEIGDEPVHSLGFVFTTLASIGTSCPHSKHTMDTVVEGSLDRSKEKLAPQ